MSTKSISSILIVNRGEIACRIIDSCQREGIHTIAVYSDADASARHVRMADEAHRLGPAETAASYLNQEALLALIDTISPDAVHPGYGFLSENASFVKQLEQRPLTFIGPSSKVIHAMGDKIEAKKIANAAGAPLVPGMLCDGTEEDVQKRIKAFADKEGLPLIIKAAAGGGGRGMRKVHALDGLNESVAAAKREAKAFFDNDAVFVEKLIEGARHVEVQIIGDTHGNVIVLGDRDCSLQRFHQKVVEEAPAPFLRERTRETLHSAAISLGKEVSYVGAGTVEFLVDAEERCYFLEVNSRLQVEHPVTECIFGIDIVALQIAVARGEKLTDLLPDTQTPNGHAIEVRLCAEKPQDNFIAATGTLARLDIPAQSSEGLTIRVDTGVVTGDRITHYYDSMIAKCIVHGPSREAARQGLLQVLSKSLIAGVETNIGFLQSLLRLPAFIEGSHTIHTIDTDPAYVIDTLRSAALAALTDSVAYADTSGAPAQFEIADLRCERCYRCTIDGTEVSLQIRHDGRNQWICSDGHQQLSLQLHAGDANSLHCTLEHQELELRYLRCDDALWISGPFGALKVLPYYPALKSSTAAAKKHSGSISSPLPGKVLTVHVSEGDTVDAGTVLITIESMKMEHTIKAEAPGVVQQVLVNAETILESNKVLAIVDYDKN